MATFCSLVVFLPVTGTSTARRRCFRIGAKFLAVSSTSPMAAIIPMQPRWKGLQPSFPGTSKIQKEASHFADGVRSALTDHPILLSGGGSAASIGVAACYHHIEIYHVFCLPIFWHPSGHMRVTHRQSLVFSVFMIWCNPMAFIRRHKVLRLISSRVAATCNCQWESSRHCKIIFLSGPLPAG